MKDRNRRYQSAAEIHSDLLTYRSNIGEMRSPQARFDDGSPAVGSGARASASAEEQHADPHRLIEPSSVPAFPQVTASPSASRFRVTAGAVTAAILLLIALGALLNLGGLRERLLGSAAVPRIESLAVLPLENLSHVPEQEYLADGMTQALITDGEDWRTESHLTKLGHAVQGFEKAAAGYRARTRRRRCGRRLGGALG
jgi:hypothetical protein